MLEIILLGFFCGSIGTFLGGVIGILIPSSSQKFYAFVLEFTSGLMVSIVCFILMPEAIGISNIAISLIGYVVGVILIMFLDEYIKIKNKNMSEGYLLGLMIVLSIAIHNFPEGLAIGSGYGVSYSLGLSLLVAITLHDIPEGISIVLPMKKDKKVTKKKLLLYPFLAGIPTGFGTLTGYVIGGASAKIVGLCLSFAGGVMAYIVMGDILTESKKVYSDKSTIIGNMLGIVTRNNNCKYLTGKLCQNIAKSNIL